jgi:alpha-tubulin suppressor-like RCC1 family protein
MPRHRAQLALAALMCLGLACDPGIRLGSPCAYDSECPADLLCRAARCRAQCLADRDCPATDTCLAGGCVGRDENVDGGPPDAAILDAATPTDTGPPEADAAAPIEDAFVPDAGRPCDEIVDVAGGHAHTCAALANGRVACWGANGEGQLGDGSLMDRSSPVLVPGLTDVTELAAGHERTCALDRDGDVWCWGRNQVADFPTHHQLGSGSTSARETTPVRVALAAPAVAITAGWWHGCAALDDQVACWGMNLSGELGDGSTSPRLVPVRSGSLGPVLAIGAGSGPSCVVEGGSLRCWGFAERGGVASGSTTNVLLPRDVDFAPGLPPVLDFEGLDIGGAGAVGHGGHGCAHASGRLYCWGRNDEGQLGLGDFMDRFAVQALGDRDAQQVSAGGQHTCIVDQPGDVRCFGSNAFGQLGIDRAMPRLSSIPAAPVSDLPAVSRVATGTDHTCAILRDGELRCWGSNTLGQLGDGTRGGARHTPVAVAFTCE